MKNKNHRHLQFCTQPLPVYAQSQDPLDKILYYSDTMYVTPRTILENILYAFSPMMKAGRI